MITNEKEGDKIPMDRGKGENTPFVIQSRKKRRGIMVTTTDVSMWT